MAGGTALNPNVFKKNRAGDRSKGNGGDGIKASGVGNGNANPVEFEENNTKANGGAGISLTGNNNQFKKNLSGGTGSGEDNSGCEYDISGTPIDAGSNKANGSNVIIATGCIGTP